MRNRLDNGPYDLAILRHMAIDVMQKEGSKGSLRGKFKRAGWQDAYLIRLLRMFRCAIARPIRSDCVQEPQRERAGLPAFEGLAPRGYPIRQTRKELPGNRHARHTLQMVDLIASGA